MSSVSELVGVYELGSEQDETTHVMLPNDIKNMQKICFILMVSFIAKYTYTIKKLKYIKKYNILWPECNLLWESICNWSKTRYIRCILFSNYCFSSMSDHSFQHKISLRGVATNNLKDIDIDLPKNSLITMTWVSWSGKSSLAFHTIYKEGQFRYIESLSSYLRQFFNLWSRPELEYSSWLSPAVAIEQNKRMWNSRSTVWTLTEVDDYLRLMLSKLGQVFCYMCWDPLRPKTTDQIIEDIFKRFDWQKIYLFQDFWTFDDPKSLGKFIRKNRNHVDQWWGCTRLLLEMNSQNTNQSETTLTWESIEYFYLEDPHVPDDLFPVKVHGIFDRIQVSKSVYRRLKDDIIKMLGRADKFWVKALFDAWDEWSADKEIEDLQDENWESFLFDNKVTISKDRQKKLIDHEHTTDWCIHTTRAIIKNEDGKYMWLYDVRFDHYQLPWGKVDSWETIEQWLIREVEEEIGAKVVKTNYLGWVKLFFRIWAQVEHVYEVEVSWDITIQEPEKFSHVWYWTIKSAKTKNVTIDFGDTKNKGYHEIMEWWDYVIWLVESWLLEKLNDHGEYKIELPPMTSIEPDQLYVSYLDTNEHILRFEKESEYRSSKKKLLVFIEKGSKLLDGYVKVFWELSSWSTKKTRTTSDLVRYTDKYYCAKDDIKYPELTPAHFSANRQEWACTQCHGLWEVLQVDVDKVLDPTSRYMDAILPRRDSQLGQAILRKLAYAYQIKDSDRWTDLPQWFKEVVLQGDWEMYKLSLWWWKYISMRYKWLEDVLIDQYQKWVLTVDFQAMLDMHPCPSCGWAKLQQQALSTYIILQDNDKKEARKEWAWELINKADIWNKYNIYDLQTMPISELTEVLGRYLEEATTQSELVKRIVVPLLDRVKTVTELWLWYISSSRKIDTLSWWEIQRLRLAKQLWNKLTWIIYVLDEPTIWLDHDEILRVIKAIRGLQEMGNTIIVVEHNDEFIKASDWIVEIWPWAGDFWWHLVFNGPYDEFLKQDSLTAQYIRWDKKVTASFDHTPSRAVVSIKKASKYNLKNIDVDIQLWSFTIITWPSGAGKTTLMYHTLFTFLEEKQKWVQSQIRLQLLKEWLSRQDIIQAPVMQRKKYEHLEKLALQQFYEHIWVETITWREEIDNVLYVDQSSIWKTPRSCPATFVGVFDDIRKMFAWVTEAKMLWFNAGHFSFNSNKWACPWCKWYGHKKVELQFLPDAYVPCELCHGRRYKPEILDIRRHEHTITQILSMYVKDAYTFFEEIPFIQDKLELMMDIWLGYLKMGQPAHTLSWGESQRLKLVKHLLKQYRGHTVYFLDEPTVGLHPSDIERLLKVLKRFLNYGDTVLMIEHERNLLQFADKVVRLKNGWLDKR